jgi:hypothetical protein
VRFLLLFVAATALAPVRTPAAFRHPRLMGSMPASEAMGPVEDSPSLFHLGSIAIPPCAREQLVPHNLAYEQIRSPTNAIATN